MKEESGYTAIELTVAMGLTLLVAGLTLSAYLGGVQRVSAWRAGLELENHAHLLLRVLSEDLRRADEIEPARDGFILKLPDESRIVYQMVDDQLERNGRLVHHGALSVALFSVRSADHDLYSFTPDWRGTSQAPGYAQATRHAQAKQLQVRISMSNGSRILPLHTTVTLRRTAAWEPM